MAAGNLKIKKEATSCVSCSPLHLDGSTRRATLYGSRCAMAQNHKSTLKPFSLTLEGFLSAGCLSL